MAGDVYKPKIDTQPTAVIGTIVNNTQLTLSSNWGGTTITHKKYMIQRSFSTNLSYARTYQGDSDVADIFREQIVDKMDTDIWSALHLAKVVKKGADYAIPAGCTYNWIIMTTGNTVTLSSAANKRVFRLSKSSGNTLLATFMTDATDTMADGGCTKIFLTAKGASFLMAGDGGTKYHKLSGSTY